MTKKHFAVLILVLIIFLPFCTEGSQGSAKKISSSELYDLQGKCGTDAANFFYKIYGDGFAIPGHHYIYSNHYNKKLNKCYILITGLSMIEKDNKKDIELYDVQENNPFGYYSDYLKEAAPFCLFNGGKCSSEATFKRLVAPYMNE